MSMPPAGFAADAVLIVTTPSVPGYRVAEVRGHVFGLVVRSRGLAGNIMAGLRSLGGGEIHEYTQLLEDIAARGDRASGDACVVDRWKRRALDAV